MKLIATTILPLILVYKYVAIVVITFFSALVLPIPPGTLLMAASAMAGKGYFSLPLVVLAGAFGNVAGDITGYFLARRFGEPILRKLGFAKVLSSSRYKRIEERFRTKPGTLIFFSRFEVFSNLAVNIMSGLGKVPFRKYIVYEMSGEILQVALYCSIGYFFGNNWTAINVIINRFLALIALILVLLVIIFWKKINHKLFVELEDEEDEGKDKKKNNKNNKNK